MLKEMWKRKHCKDFLSIVFKKKLPEVNIFFGRDHFILTGWYKFNFL